MDFNVIWNYLVEQVKSNQFLAGATLTGALASVAYWCRAKLLAAYQRLKGFFAVSLTIHSEDPLYMAVSDWLHKNGFDEFSRSYRVRYDNNKVCYGPSDGVFWFFYNRRLVKVTITKEQSQGFASYRAQTKEYLTILYFNLRRSTQLLDTIVQDAVDSYKETVGSGMPVYAHVGMGWNLVNYIPKRSTSAVILEGTMLETLEADIRQFLDRKDWYTERGVPYHRGYLLTGPPGTGKTSLVRHLAQKFQMPVYISDGSITSIRTAPPKSILLLEDVDSIAKMREAASTLLRAGSAGVGGSSISNTGPQSTDGNVPDFNIFAPSLSELLNALDGLASTEETLVVMTTNFPETLDPAVLRPGRVDKTLYLGKCSVEQATRLFVKFYGSEYARDFNAVITPDTHTPAQLQELFVSSLQPHDAIAALQNRELVAA